MADPENNFKTHFKTLSQLNGKKRFEFIWEYYRLQIILTVVILISVIYFFNSVVFNRVTYDFTVAFYGNHSDYYERMEIENELEEEFSLTVRVIAFDVLSYNANYASSQAAAFMGEYVIGGIDVIIADEIQMQRLIESGYINKYEPYSNELFAAITLNSQNVEIAEKVIANANIM